MPASARRLPVSAASADSRMPDRLPTLAGRSVALRWLTPADVPALFALFGDPEVTRYWSSPAMRELADAEALLADIVACFESGTLFQWGIARTSDDHVIGTCTLGRIDRDHRRAELGYALGRPHWGGGLASEAVQLALGYAFDELGLHRIEADIDPRNERSIALVTRLGFRREGYLRERYHVGGEIQDALLFGLLAREWRRGG
jgi:RimJ/RimL family protein N-acetyltransferase